MGWFQRTFLNNSAARIERAERYLEREEYNNARLELTELDEPIAHNLLEKALAGLVEINLEESLARFSSGDYDGANEHLELATRFGATQSQVNTVRKRGREFQKQEQLEAAIEAQKKKKTIPVGNDPIYSLPPDHPKLLVTIYLEGYPTAIRERFVNLGQEFLEAILKIEGGKPQQAHTTLSNFIEREPAARFERARAALALGMIPSAISDLMMFGEEVGHQEINNTHTGALLSQLLMQIGRGEEGLSELNTLLTKDNHPSLRIVRSQILEAKGKLDEAEKATQNILKDFPKSLPIIRQLARIRLKLDKRVLAASTLETGLKSCCTPGSCSSQPMDVEALRMLARIYLEDNVLPKRCLEILDTLNKHVKNRIWEDDYLTVLHNRNNGVSFVEDSAKILLQQLKEGDHRRQWVEKSFSLA